MKNRILLSVLLALSGLSTAAAMAQAAAPLYDVHAYWGDASLTPGGKGQFSVQIRNVGDEDGKGPITILAQLPEGVTATNVSLPFGVYGDLLKEYGLCSGVGTETVQCELTDFLVSEFRGPGLGLGLAPSTKVPRPPRSRWRRGISAEWLFPDVIDVAIDPEASGSPRIRSPSPVAAPSETRVTSIRFPSVSFSPPLASCPAASRPTSSMPPIRADR